MIFNHHFSQKVWGVVRKREAKKRVIIAVVLAVAELGHDDADKIN